MSSQSIEETSRQLRKLNVDKKNKFFDWTPENSTRETRKLTRKTYSERAKTNRYFDQNGCLLSTGEDVCDCLEERCPGCHFPCPKCSSLKCGHECRQNRRWVYDLLEVDGKEGAALRNKNK